MDFGTVIGVVLAFALIIWAIMLGESYMAFVDAPSVLIVVGGSLSAALIAVPFSTLKKVLSVTRKALFVKPQSPHKLIAELVNYAEIARRDGILSLESHVQKSQDPFIVRGVQMAVDGTDPELIEQILNTELENLADRHANGKSVFDGLGKYAPAFGMIGTLIGLVAMLANMSDPSKIGAGMAVALITTLYGAVLSNVVALPIAEKLGKRSAEELLLKTIILKGVMAIQSGDNPRIVEQKLLTFLPPSQRAAPNKGGDAEQPADTRKAA